jgi:hypothetical protein
VEQLRSLPLRALSLSGYRLLPNALASIAEALPALRRLHFEAGRVEHPEGRLELAGLAALTLLHSFSLRLLTSRGGAPDPRVAPLPGTATSLHQLRRLALARVRPAEGLEDAFWASLALLPAVRELEYEECGHIVRQPPPQLLELGLLTSLRIQASVAASKNGLAAGVRCCSRSSRTFRS